MNLRHIFQQIVGTIRLAPILLMGCAAVVDQQSVADIDPIATPISGQGWVIFSSEYAEETMHRGAWLAQNRTVDGYWAPSADDIKELEKNLVEYLRQNADEFNQQPPVWERLDEYQRQYIGVISNKDKIIYGSYFCSNSGLPWQQELLEFSDGGECYFQILYDKDRGQFIVLRVNGES